MILSLFKAVFYQPLYNALVLLTVYLPGESLGLAIILLTIIVRLALYPIYHKSLTTQRKLREIDGQLKDIKEKTKDNKQEQAQQIINLYREHGINPLTSFVVLIIQIPIIISLFYVFRGSISIDPTLLYSFVPSPEAVNHIFLNLFDVTQKSIPMALLVGLTQFFQMKLAIPPLPPPDKSKIPSFKDDLMKSMNIQMRYVMPVMITFISFALPSALALYWLTSNLFSIGHELLIKRQALKIKTSA